MVVTQSVCCVSVNFINLIRMSNSEENIFWIFLFLFGFSKPLCEVPINIGWARAQPGTTLQCFSTKSQPTDASHPLLLLINSIIIIYPTSRSPFYRNITLLEVFSVPKTTKRSFFVILCTEQWKRETNPITIPPPLKEEEEEIKFLT